jgi:hypothetical protein
MKIKFTRSTAVGGRHYEAGSVVDIEQSVALQIVAIGKAVIQSASADRPAAQTMTPPEGLTPEGKRSKAKKADE